MLKKSFFKAIWFSGFLFGNVKVEKTTLEIEENSTIPIVRNKEESFTAIVWEIID